MPKTTNNKCLLYSSKCNKIKKMINNSNIRVKNHYANKETI